MDEQVIMLEAFPDRVGYKLSEAYRSVIWLPHESLPPIIAECRIRSSTFGEYKTYAMRLDKYMYCMQLAEMMGGFFHIVTGWDDGVIAVAQLVTERSCHFTIKTAMVGNVAEPAVHIPIGAFKIIK